MQRRLLALLYLLAACSPGPAPVRSLRAAATCPIFGAVFGAVPDGHDAVLSLFEADTLQTMRLSDCTETARRNVPGGPRALVRLDGALASASTGSLDVSLPGGGTASAALSLVAGALHAADLDSDGAQELLATLGSTAAEARLAVYRRTGSTLASVQELAISGASSLASADLDGDGDLDVLVARATDDRLTVLENRGGSLAPLAEHEVCNEPFAVTTVQLPNEPPSPLVTCRTGGLELLRPRDGGYERRALPRAGTLYETAAADFDGDGKLDLASVDPFGHQLVTWWGRSPGEWESPVELAMARGPILLRTFDFDTNSTPDILVIAFQDRSVTVFHNEGISR